MRMLNLGVPEFTDGNLQLLRAKSCSSHWFYTAGLLLHPCAREVLGFKALPVRIQGILCVKR